jgi:hypothetical protein
MVQCVLYVGQRESVADYYLASTDRSPRAHAAATALNLELTIRHPAGSHNLNFTPAFVLSAVW